MMYTQHLQHFSRAITYFPPIFLDLVVISEPINWKFAKLNANYSEMENVQIQIFNIVLI